VYLNYLDGHIFKVEAGGPLVSGDASSKAFMLIPRKVQRLGASSLIVTLPKDWARRNGIKVGDVISLIDVGDRLIILPKNYVNKTVISFDGKHKRVVTHIGRVSLCGFIFGQDRIIITAPRQSIVRDILSRLEKTMKVLPYIYVRGKGKQVIIDLESPLEDPWGIFKSIGSHTVNYLEKLIKLLDSGDGLKLEDVESFKLNARRKGFRLLRAVALSDTRGGLKSVLSLHIFLYASLLTVAVEEFYNVGHLLIKFRDKLDQQEKERIRVLLQLLEVALSTLSTNVDSYSVKKVEEAYWKLKGILDLKDNIEDVLEDSSPYYAFILSKLIDIASLLELAGSVMACFIMTYKYSSSIEETKGEGTNSEPR